MSDCTTPAEACKAGPENLPIAKKTDGSGDQPSIGDNEKITRIRTRYYQALADGMTIPEASAYANDGTIAGLSVPPLLRISMWLIPATENDAAHQKPEQQPASPLPAQLELTSSDFEALRALFPDHQSTLPERVLDASDPDVAAGMPTQNSDPLGESELAADGGDERPAQPNAANSRPATVDRLPNGKFPPGRTGNPKGRPKKPSNDVDPPSELERILERTITVTQGGNKRKLKQATAILEQWVNQAVKGDHRARRELLAYADKHGIDLFRRHHKEIAKALATAALSSAYYLSPEVMDRLSPSAIDEIRKAIEEVEAEKKNTRTVH